MYVELVILFYCVYKFFRGDNFRMEYARLGNVRSILSPDVNVMALTATQPTRCEKRFVIL